MIDRLSILLPCYNNVCTDLVTALSRQAENIVNSGRRLDYEIIVADDGSTDHDAINRNKAIDRLPHARYVLRGHNTGRSAIRNWLAREARHPWLLFIDSDLGIDNDNYLAAYLALDSAEVTCGGYTVSGDPKALRHNLRYAYENKNRNKHMAAERLKHPYENFHTSNFMIRRSIMLDHPLDERIRRYGYEDILFGKNLGRLGISITHIDNPLVFNSFENNAAFTAKTSEGMATLAEFENELRGYSPLITMAERLDRLHLTPFVRAMFKTFVKPIKNNITGNNPSLLLFNIYKLGTFCTLINGKRQR